MDHGDRDAWPATREVAAGGTPCHECLVKTPEGDSIEFVELDDAADVCTTRTSQRGLSVFGPTANVIAAATRRPIHDAWVQAVTSALDAERHWTEGARRSLLKVYQGTGLLAHATASVNRASISEWGLDWTRMGPAPGIAGRLEPELPAVFLDHVSSIGFFTGMSRLVCDVWEVNVEGLWLEDYEGWIIHGHPIEPSRLRLMRSDLPPRTARGWSRLAGGDP
jgi:hypothetical protein